MGTPVASVGGIVTRRGFLKVSICVGALVGSNWEGTTSYSQYEQMVVARGIAQPPSALPEFETPRLVIGAVAVAGVAAAVAASRRGPAVVGEPEAS